MGLSGPELADMHLGYLPRGVFIKQELPGRRLHRLLASVMGPEASWQGAGSCSCSCLGFKGGETSVQMDRGRGYRLLPPWCLAG